MYVSLIFSKYLSSKQKENTFKNMKSFILTTTIKIQSAKIEHDEKSIQRLIECLKGHRAGAIIEGRFACVDQDAFYSSYVCSGGRCYDFKILLLDGVVMFYCMVSNSTLRWCC